MNAVSESDMAIDDTVVYRKSGLGAAQLAAIHNGSLSPRERQVLILLDGRRTLAEISQVFGVDAARRLTTELEARGFARRVDPTLPPEWASTVTRFHVDSFSPEISRPTLRSKPEPAPHPEPTLRSQPEPAPHWHPEPAPRWHRDWFVLVNLGMLAFVAIMVGGLWLIDKRPTSAVLPFGAIPVQAGPIDAQGSRNEIDAVEPESSPGKGVTRFSHLPADPASRAIDGGALSEHTPPQPVSSGRRPVARSEAPDKSP